MWPKNRTSLREPSQITFAFFGIWPRMYLPVVCTFYVCSKFSIFLTTYPPLNVNVICEGSLKVLNVYKKIVLIFYVKCCIIWKCNWSSKRFLNSIIILMNKNCFVLADCTINEYFSVTFYFSPTLGLFNLLHHYQVEHYQISWNNALKIPVFKKKKNHWGETWLAKLADSLI